MYSQYKNTCRVHFEAYFILKNYSGVHFSIICILSICVSHSNNNSYLLDILNKFISNIMGFVSTVYDI